MAIRRISDLPNIESINPDHSFELSDGLFEMSYHAGNHVYKSFYIDGETLTAKIQKSLPPVGDFVTRTTPQTIEASKTFLSSIQIGPTAGSTNIKFGGDGEHTIKSTATLSSEIDIRTKDLAVTPAALVSYIDAQGFMKTGVDPADFEKLQQLIDSMLHPKTKYCFVKTGGDDRTGEAQDSSTYDSSKSKPFATIAGAVSELNKYRFLRGSYGHIRLLTDIDLGAPTSYDAITKLVVYHPDLVQNQALYIEGYDENGNPTQRNITCHIKDATQEAANNTVIQCYCHAILKNINFVGDIGDEWYQFSKENKLCIEDPDITNKPIPTVILNNGGSDTVEVLSCNIRNGYRGLGGPFFSIKNMGLSNMYAISDFGAGRRCRFDEGLSANKVVLGIRGSIGSTVYFSMQTPSIVAISATNQPISLYGGASMTFDIYSSTNGMWNGTTLLPGYKFNMYKLSNSGATLQTYDTTGSNSGIDGYIRKISNMPGKGYGDTGYITFSSPDTNVNAFYTAMFN